MDAEVESGCGHAKRDKLRKENRGVAQLASALAWGARGRPFKSDHPDKEERGRIFCPFH